MFKKFWNYTKKHPLLVGLMVIFGVILVWMLTRGGSKSDSTSVYMPGQDPAALAAATQMGLAQNAQNAQMSMAQLQASVTNHQTDAQLSALTDTNKTQLEIAKLSADVQKTSAGFQFDAAKFVAQQNAQMNIQVATINATTALQASKDTNQARIQVAGIQGNSAFNIARVGAMADVIGFETQALAKLGAVMNSEWGSAQNSSNEYFGQLGLGGGSQQTKSTSSSSAWGRSTANLTGAQITTLFDKIIAQSSSFFKMAPQKIN
jgi:hypothetical protein